VRESRFGRWLMGTRLWYRDVLSRALADFAPLLEGYQPEKPTVLDAGCGEGLAFKLLERQFSPSAIVGLDLDKDQINKAIRRAARIKTQTHIILEDVSQASFRDDTFDIIFAHHLLHHTLAQDAMVQKLMRLLKPGGVLLVAGPCRMFTQSWPVRWLFRHPASAQKTAQDYVQLMRQQGFIVDDARCAMRRPWWSRRTLGLAQKLGIPNNPEPTMLLLVAQKPYPQEEDERLAQP
jgi:SAM-dependent methyltransferase